MHADQLTLGEVAEMVGAELRSGDPARPVNRLSYPTAVGEADLTFIDQRFAPALLHGTQAAVLAPASMAEAIAVDTLLIASAPHAALLAVARELWRRQAFPTAATHPTAVVDATAQIGEGCYLGPHCVIAAGVRLGAGCAVHAGAVIQSGARIGAGSYLGPHAVVGAGVTTGERCVIHAGAVLGFAWSALRPAGYGQAPHCAGVVLGDEVEIGPNCVVQAGEQQPTLLEQGVHLGALSMVAHDVVIGANARLVAMAGLAGESRIGAGAVLMGQVGVSSRSVVGERAVVLAKSGVDKDIPAHTIATGIPARTRMDWLRRLAAPRMVPDLVRRVAELTRRVDTLEGRSP